MRKRCARQSSKCDAVYGDNSAGSRWRWSWWFWFIDFVICSHLIWCIVVRLSRNLIVDIFCRRNETKLLSFAPINELLCIWLTHLWIDYSYCLNVSADGMY